MTKEEEKITVPAVASREEPEDKGTDVGQTVDTLEEARTYASHLVTEGYRQTSEPTMRLGSSQVLVDGKFVTTTTGGPQWMNAPGIIFAGPRATLR